MRQQQLHRQQVVATLGGPVLLNEGRMLRLRDADGIEIELVAR